MDIVTRDGASLGQPATMHTGEVKKLGPVASAWLSRSQSCLQAGASTAAIERGVTDESAH